MLVVNGIRGRRGRAAVGPRGLISVLVIALAATGTAVAGEVPRAAAKIEQARRALFAVQRDRLVPRVSVEMETLSSVHRMAQPGNPVREHVMFDELSRTVRRGAKRATRKAVKAYLLDAVNLDRGIDRIRREIRGRRDGERNLDVHVGVHSLLPEVGLRYRRGQKSFGVTVGADGDVGVRFRNDRYERAEFAAGFDGDDTFRVHALLGF